MTRSPLSIGRALTAVLVLVASLVASVAVATDAVAMTESDFAAALLASCNAPVNDSAKGIHLPQSDGCKYFPKDIDQMHGNLGGPADPLNFKDSIPAGPSDPVLDPSQAAGNPTMNCSSVPAQYRLILSDTESKSIMAGFQVGYSVGFSWLKYTFTMQYWHTWTDSNTTTDMVVVNAPPWSMGQITFGPEVYVDQGWLRVQFGSAVAGPSGEGHFYWYVPFSIKSPAVDSSTGASGAYEVSTAPLTPDAILTNCAQNGGVTPQQMPLVNEGATQTDQAPRCLNALTPPDPGYEARPRLQPCGPSPDQHFLLLQVGNQTTTATGVGSGPPVYLLASVGQRTCVTFTDNLYPYSMQPCDSRNQGQQFTANPVKPTRTPPNSTGNAFTLSNAAFPNECLRGASATAGAQFYPVGRCNQDEPFQVWSTTPAYF